jgi:hypothetical protein
MKDKAEQENRDEGKHKKPIVTLSAFALMLLGAGGVGSSALASTSTASSQLAQPNVAAQISKAELAAAYAETSNPKTARPLMTIHNFIKPNNHAHNHGADHDNVHAKKNLAMAFEAGSVAHRFDV